MPKDNLYPERIGADMSDWPQVVTDRVVDPD